EKQSRRSNQQSNTSQGSQHHRDARVRVWRDPAEYQVINRSNGGRREAEREPVEGAVMHPAAPRRALLFGVHAVARVMQMPQRDNVACRLRLERESRLEA